jgi:hypothetical protein
MTQIEWQQLEAAIAHMTDAEKKRLATLLVPPGEPKAEPKPDPILGLFADEPELIQFIIDQTYLARETHPLRLGD